MTLSDFANVFAVLAVQLRATDADEITIKSYYEPLKDLELEFVQMAAAEMAKAGGSHGDNPHWFPKSSEWRALAWKIERDRIQQQREVLRKLPAPLCLVCDDTGWDRTDDDRVHHCACRSMRRLEVLGRRPMPELPPAVEEPQHAVDTLAIATTLASTKGMR